LLATNFFYFAFAVQQVVHLVLANAFKYTRRVSQVAGVMAEQHSNTSGMALTTYCCSCLQGTVQIEAEQSQDKQYVTLRISDTGPGFGHEHIEKFTSPYTGQCRHMGVDHSTQTSL
jgi:signal transduction histidine kinase